MSDPPPSILSQAWAQKTADAFAAFDIFSTCSCPCSRHRQGQATGGMPPGGHQLDISPTLDAQIDYMQVPSKASFKIDASRSSGSTDVPNERANSTGQVDDWDVSDNGGAQLPGGPSQPSMSPSGKTKMEQDLAMLSIGPGYATGKSLPKGLAMLSDETDRHPFRSMTGSLVETCSQDDFMDDVLADTRKLQSAMNGYLNSLETPPDAKADARVTELFSSACPQDDAEPSRPSRKSLQFGEFQAAFRMDDAFDSPPKGAAPHEPIAAGLLHGESSEDDDDIAAPLWPTPSREAQGLLDACFEAADSRANKTTSIRPAKDHSTPSSHDDVDLGDISPIPAEQITGALAGVLDAESRAAHGRMYTPDSSREEETVARDTALSDDVGVAKVTSEEVSRFLAVALSFEQPHCLEEQICTSRAELASEDNPASAERASVVGVSCPSKDRRMGSQKSWLRSLGCLGESICSRGPK